MGFTELLGLGLDLIPSFLQFDEANRRRENPPVVGRQTGRAGAVTSFQGGEVPQGGFNLSPFLQSQVNQLETTPETVKGGFLGLFDVPNPEFEGGGAARAQELIQNDKLTESQARELQELLRELGKDELAGEIGFQLSQQTGGLTIDVGVRDLLQAGLNDLQQAKDISGREEFRQLEALGIQAGISEELLPQIQRQIDAGFKNAKDQEKIAENRALSAIRSGALPALAPLIQAQNLRDEIQRRTEDTTVSALESQRVGLNRRHDSQIKSARVQLEQQFPGNPGAVEAQLNQIRSTQLNDLTTAQNGLITEFIRIERDVDLQTANFVQQASSVTAANLVDISRMEAQAIDVFQTRRTQLNQNKISNDYSISMLEKDNRQTMAGLLRGFTEMFIPEQELVNQIFSINTFLEDRQLAFEAGTFALTLSGATGIATSFQAFQAQKAAQDAQKEAESQASTQNTLGFASLGVGAFTAGLGALPAAAAPAAAVPGFTTAIPQSAASLGF